MVVTETDPRETRRGWMLVRGLLAQNLVIGCSYGTFGISMIGLQERYQVGRGTISLGFSLVILGMGLLGPVISRSVDRFGFRRTMMTGAVLAGTGYAILALSSHVLAFFLAFGLFIGPGVAMTGTLPVGLLVGGWYPESRGRAVGLATMPILLSLMPMLGTALITREGMSVFYGLIAVLHFLMLAVIMGIQRAPGHAPAPIAQASDQPDTGRSIVGRPIFWVLVLAGGILNSVSITGVANVVSLLVEEGTSPAQAAFMASLMGVAAVCGAFSIGWLCDLVGGARALALAALGLAGSWITLSGHPGFGVMLVALIAMGVCGAGTFPAVTVICSRLFGLPHLGKALALFGLYTVPLTFFLPPLAGWLHDATGGYPAVIACIVAGCVAAAAVFLLIGQKEQRATIA